MCHAPLLAEPRADAGDRKPEGRSAPDCLSAASGGVRNVHTGAVWGQAWANERARVVGGKSVRNGGADTAFPSGLFAAKARHDADLDLEPQSPLRLGSPTVAVGRLSVWPDFRARYPPQFFAPRAGPSTFIY